MNMIRAATVGTHPRFVRMIRELIEERMAVTRTVPRWENSGRATMFARMIAV